MWFSDGMVWEGVARVDLVSETPPHGASEMICKYDCLRERCLDLLSHRSKCRYVVQGNWAQTRRFSGLIAVAVAVDFKIVEFEGTAPDP